MTAVRLRPARPGSPGRPGTRCWPPTSWWPSWPRSTTRSPTTTPPGRVVAVAPSSWSDDPAFVERPARRAGRQPDHPTGHRRPSSSPPSPTPPPATAAASLPRAAAARGCRSAAIRTQRQRIDSFSVAATDGPRPSSAPARRPGAGRRVRPPPPGPAVGGARTTPGRPSTPNWPSWRWPAGSRSPSPPSRAPCPIDIVSSAPLPGHGHADPHQRQAAVPQRDHRLDRADHRACRGHSHTNVVYVTVRARTSGVFTVGITLDSPVGRAPALQRPDRRPVHRHLDRGHRPVPRCRAGARRVVGADLAQAARPAAGRGARRTSGPPREAG